MASLDWYKVEQLPWPADWASIFGRTGPLMVEIGFGSGLFLVDFAGRMPEANLIGVEISLPSLRNAASKIQRMGLTNVCLIHGSAGAALQALCAPQSLSAVVINFPDPWPKKDQLGRRLIDDSFLCLLATRIQKGGDLDIATDHEEYAGQIDESLHRSPHFTSRLDSSFTFDDPGRIRTKYEQIAVEEARAPRYFKWRRNDTPVENPFPPPEEYPMPHVVIRVPADTAEIGRRFRHDLVEIGPTRIRFVEAYRSLRDGKLLIETYINEDPIVQRIGLEMRARPTGEIVISLAEVGFPRPTRGVHLAIGRLVDWLRQEFPSLIVVQSTLQGDHADSSR